MKGEGPGAHCRGHICRAIAQRLSRKLRKLAPRREKKKKKGGLAAGAHVYDSPFEGMTKKGTAVFVCHDVTFAQCLSAR